MQQQQYAVAAAAAPPPASVTAQMEAMHRVVAKLRQCDAAAPFQDPVPREVPGYYEVIQQPIDLSTIWAKMARGLYASASHVHHDVLLIIKNCNQFNLEGSEISNMAAQLESVYNALCKEAGLM